MNRLIRILSILAALWAAPTLLLAAPDQYLGDSAIYSAESVQLRPNVLFLVDNSNKAADLASGQKYDPTKTYPTQGFASWGVYTAGQQGDFKANGLINTSADSGLTSIQCVAVRNVLKETGTYAGSSSAAAPNLANNSGACVTDGKKADTYAVGNYLNYLATPPEGVVVKGTGANPKDYKLIQTHVAAADNRPTTGANWTQYWVDAGTTGKGIDWVSGNSYVLTSSSKSQIQIVYEALANIVNSFHGTINFGAAVYSQEGNKGGKVISAITDLSDSTARQTYLNKLPGSGNAAAAELLSSQTARPQAEALLDAGYYFRGQSMPVSGHGGFSSPISKWCDNNYIIFITNGLSNKDDDGNLGSIVGDRDGDGREPGVYGLGTHYLDDVAKFLYETDASSSLAGTQRVKTSTILAFQADDELVGRAGDNSHGRGGYYNVYNAHELAAALSKIFTNIVLEADSAFVSPTVPASPENRSYSSSRIYLGFFKPQSQKPWLGNLKKFGLGQNNQIVDKTGAKATNSDGSFSAGAISYWGNCTGGTCADAGQVDRGGVGQVLKDRNLSTSPRKLYSNLTTTSDLTASGNAFNKTNLTPGLLGVAGDTERDKLVDYIAGRDAYDDNDNGNTTENREWLLGDIRHSKPAVVNYRPFTLANESSCSENKSMIFVGTNDGMLHAFTDCDGQEAWTFLPDKVLPNLKEMAARPAMINYYVDASPIMMRYDANKDGTIDPASDKMVLIFGLRRGGNAYYALDVTSPLTPKLLWRFDAASSGFGHLGETWSDPQFAKVKIGTTSKIVAFFGAGYDINEDGRFGATGSFPAAITQSQGSGNLTSTGTTAASSRPTPLGRGMYAIDVANLSSGNVPTLATSPAALWSYTVSNNSAMQYAFPTDPSLVDSDGDGYIDMVYAGDTGGQLWRFNVKDTSTSNWGGEVIFTSAASSGRKFFYKPAVAVEGDIRLIAIGSGDREHPLNTALVDRMYLIKDKGQTGASNIGEGNLMDVTANELQGTGTSPDRQQELLTSLNSSSNYGWMIQLASTGEKVLAPPLILNKVAYFTTYAPNTTVAVDPCAPGNLGTSRLYALNYKTGEAALNFHSSNDTTSVNNERALNKDGKVLLTADRVVTLGSGIPSGLTLVIRGPGEGGGDEDEDGDGNGPGKGKAGLLMSCGGGVCREDPDFTIRPRVINWRTW
jgi:type IV pilus assembly protein PilY1